MFDYRRRHSAAASYGDFLRATCAKMLDGDATEEQDEAEEPGATSGHMVPALELLGQVPEAGMEVSGLATAAQAPVAHSMWHSMRSSNSSSPALAHSPATRCPSSSAGSSPAVVSPLHRLFTWQQLGGASSKNVSPSDYAAWYQKHTGTETVNGLPTPAEYKEEFETRIRRLRRPSGRHPRHSHSSVIRKSVCDRFKLSNEARACEQECVAALTCEHCSKDFKTVLQLKGHEGVCELREAIPCTYCAMRVRQKDKYPHELTCEGNPELGCDWCGLKFPLKCLRVKHQRQCPCNPAKCCAHCQQKFPTRVAAVVHSVFCHANVSSCAETGTCTACGEDDQCIRFPCREHVYCAQCVFSQVRLGLKDRSMFPLRCCRQEVEPGDNVDIAIAQMLPDESREKYQETMLLKFSKDVMYCPSAECGCVIKLDDIRGSGNTLGEGPHGCPKCQQALCFTCKSEWHAGLNCNQYQFFAGKHRDETLKLCKNMGWMRCFECGHVVEKKDGCNHITCVCGAEFCYLCGTKWGQCGCALFDEDHLGPQGMRHYHHANVRMVTCRWCQQAYAGERELQVHLNVCRTRLDRLGGAYECPSCYVRYQTREALREHRQICHVLLKGEYKCVRCNVVFENVAALRVHRRTCGIEIPGC